MSSTDVARWWRARAVEGTVDQHGRPLVLDDGRLRAYDRGGRHFPTHLPWNAVTSSLQVWNADWWGWGKIAWDLSDPVVPKHTFRRR